MPLHVNRAVIPLKLDTGAQVNLINELDIKAMTVKPRIHLYYSKPLRAYNGQPIISKGSCRLKVKVKGKYNGLAAILGYILNFIHNKLKMKVKKKCIGINPLFYFKLDKY